MLKKILKLEGFKKLSNNEQKAILGGLYPCPFGMFWYSQCSGCPSYCKSYNEVPKIVYKDH